MKTTHTIASSLCATATLLSLTLGTWAQPPRGGPGGPGGHGGPGGPGGPGMPPPPLAGEMAPLGPLADKFHAFQRAQLHGEAFYNKEETELQQLHAATYHKIAEHLISDKISELRGSDFVSSLIVIGTQHRTAAAAGGAAVTKTALGELSDAVTKEARQEIKEEELTPDINRVELQMDGLVRFASTDEKLKSKAASLKRRMDDLVDEESGAKKDRKVTDREREKLTHEANHAWAEFLKIIKR